MEAWARSEASRRAEFYTIMRINGADDPSAKSGTRRVPASAQRLGWAEVRMSGEHGRPLSVRPSAR